MKIFRILFVGILLIIKIPIATFIIFGLSLMTLVTILKYQENHFKECFEAIKDGMYLGMIGNKSFIENGSLQIKLLKRLSRQ